MRFEKLSDQIDYLNYAEEFDLLNDRPGRISKRNILLGEAGSFEYELLVKRVHGHQKQFSLGPPFHTPANTKGSLALGRAMNRTWLRCSPMLLNEHSLTLGSSGAGKTTRLCFIILQILTLSTLMGAWLFDFRKNGFAILKPILALFGVDLTVVRARQMRLNPLQVPRNTDPRTFASLLADALVRILRLPLGAAKLLHFVLIGLYSSFGVLAGGRLYPTLFDLKLAVEECKDYHAESRRAIIASLNTILASVGASVCYNVGWAAEDMSRMYLALDVSGLTETEQNFFLILLLLPLFRHRIDSNRTNPAMDLLVVCDEAGRLCSDKDSSISDLITACRGTGIGLDLSLQSGDQINPIVASNTSCKFLGRCGSAQDYNTMAAAMGLSSDQRHWITNNLEPGLFVGSLSQGPLRRPFLFRIPNLRLTNPDGSPRDVDQVVKTIAQLEGPILNERT